MKTKFIFSLILMLGIGLNSFASDDTRSNDPKPTIVVVEDNSDVIFTMNDINITTPIENEKEVVKGKTIVLKKMNVNKIVWLPYWVPVDDGYGGVQIYEEWERVPNGMGGTVEGPTGRCKSALTGLIYDCDTGGPVE